MENQLPDPDNIVYYQTPVGVARIIAEEDFLVYIHK